MAREILDPIAVDRFLELRNDFVNHKEQEEQYDLRTDVQSRQKVYGNDRRIHPRRTEDENDVYGYLRKHIFIFYYSLEF